MNNPVLSVVMPVYNGEKYLGEAIESVLDQTFKDFEFIIINDGSTDRSLEIIMSYCDNRIRVVNNTINYGIAYSRNLGIKTSRGEFLTWTDCDDINLPARFEKQIRFLNKNPVFGGCGAMILRFGGAKNNVFRVYKDPNLVKAALLFKPSIPNATAMLRMSCIKEFDLSYNIVLPIAEDYDFILRCSMFFPLTNIREVLYKYRDSETSIMKHFESREQKSYEIHKYVYIQALGYLGIRPHESDLRIHSLICSEKLLNNLSDFNACCVWLQVLKLKNAESKVYNPKAFDRILNDQLFFICKKSSQLGLIIFRYYLTRLKVSPGYPNFYGMCKLFIRCLIRYKKF